MPKRSDDTSPGDARQPYSDIGGPAARHAETHDVRQEELTNPKGPEPTDTSFDDDLGPTDEPGALAGHADESVPAVGDKRIQALVEDQLSSDEMVRLTVLEEGARLEQGGVYVDLKDLAAGPFKAIGGQEAGKDDRYVAKRDTDHELWNRPVGDRDSRVERPG